MHNELGVVAIKGIQLLVRKAGIGITKNVSPVL